MVVLLTIAVALCLAALVVVSVVLLRTRRRLAIALANQHSPRPTRSLQAAGRAVQVVVDTAARVREGGVSELVMSSIQDFTRWAGEDRAEIASTAAPDGTVTIFFSDIEDSTVLNERLGDARWVNLLEAHNRVVRAQIASCGGHIVKTQGDGFMIVFGDPGAAIRAALGVQADLATGRGRSLRHTPIKVRIGMHLGKVKSRDGDYFGRNVAMAARVAARADGGQILVSGDMRNALTGQDGISFGDAGDVELKGLTGTHQLWRVEG